MMQKKRGHDIVIKYVKGGENWKEICVWYDNIKTDLKEIIFVYT